MMKIQKLQLQRTVHLNPFEILLFLAARPLAKHAEIVNAKRRADAESSFSFRA